MNRNLPKFSLSFLIRIDVHDSIKFTRLGLQCRTPPRSYPLYLDP